MLRKGDVQWWVLEARKYPESASIAIEVLAERLAELDAENERLRNEMIRLRERVPAEASSGEVKALRHQVERLQYLLKSQAATEAATVFLSDQLKSARVPISEVHKLVRTGDAPLSSRALLELRRMLIALPHDELLFITSEGRGMRQLLPDIPPLAENGHWPNDRNPILGSSERLAVAVAVGEPPRFWTIATRRGYVQRFVRAAFEREMDKGDPLLRSLLDRDEATAIVKGDRGDLFLVTRWGQATRFSHRAIDVQGSIALDLEEGDQVMDALSIYDHDEILIATASGYVARRTLAQLPARVKPGGTRGKQLIRAQDVLAVFPFTSQDWLLYLTFSGKLLLISTEDIPLLERLSNGTQVCDLGSDPAVAVALISSDLV
jgi:DNA gyrase/topoisomerase IV subunit A